jgi:CheY-like chemotaxis protein
LTFGKFMVSLKMTNPGDESLLRVLLLDDDPLDVRLMQDTLHASRNCQVTALASKPALLAYLWEALPDVVISDTNIPGFNGLNALELMQKLHPGIPFVICSGSESQALRAAAVAGGAKAWVSKNDLPGLVEVVKRVRSGLSQIGERAYCDCPEGGLELPLGLPRNAVVEVVAVQIGTTHVQYDGKIFAVPTACVHSQMKHPGE